MAEGSPGGGWAGIPTILRSLLPDGLNPFSELRKVHDQYHGGGSPTTGRFRRNGSATMEEKTGPCQKQYNDYMQCHKKFDGTIDMLDCEDIAAAFQQCIRETGKEELARRRQSGAVGDGAGDTVHQEYAQIGADADSQIVKVKLGGDVRAAP